MRALSVVRFVTAALLVCISGSGASGAPQLKYVGAGGCSNIVVYGWTQDHKEALIVRADREQLGLRVGANTVTVKADRKGLDVAVELYENPQPHLPEYYCNDVRLPEWERPSTRLTAVSGSLRITLGAPGAVTVEGKPPGVYEATVTLHGVTFQRPDGTRVPPGPPITLKAIVGYVLG